jgi:hypothetical protein
VIAAVEVSIQTRKSTNIVSPQHGSSFEILYLSELPKGSLTSDKPIVTSDLEKLVKFSEIDIVAFQGIVYEKLGKEVAPNFQMESLVDQFGNKYQFVYVPYMTQLLGIHYNYIDKMITLFDGKQQDTFGLHHTEGIGMFSKFPVLDTGYIRLSRDYNDPHDILQRICLRTLIDTPVGSVNVFFASLSFTSVKSRLTHIVEVIHLLDLFLNFRTSTM